MHVGEVVCRVSILPSDAQNRPESEFFRASHRSSTLSSSPINQLGKGRKRTETRQHLACAPSPIHARTLPLSQHPVHLNVPSDHSPIFQS
jgi:hypothetical protein